MLPGRSSNHLSAPGCSELPNPPGSAPVVLALLDLLRAASAAESVQDGIPGGDPTTRRKRGTMQMEKAMDLESECWVLVLPLSLAV